MFERTLNENKHVYVSVDIARLYNVTAAMVFGHISYHIITHNNYDTAVTATKNYLGISRATVIKYVNQFFKDRYFTKIDGVEHYRKALVFRENIEIANPFLERSKNAYLSAFTKTSQKGLDKTELVKINIADLKPEEGMKAEVQRSRLFCKNLFIDKFASKKINTGNYEQKLISFATWRKMAKEFGVCVNTVKSIITELVAQNAIEQIKHNGEIVLKYTDKIKQLVIKKYKILKKIVDNKITNAKNSKPPETFKEVRKRLKIKALSTP